MKMNIILLSFCFILMNIFCTGQQKKTVIIDGEKWVIKENKESKRKSYYNYNNKDINIVHDIPNRAKRLWGGFLSDGEKFSHKFYQIAEKIFSKGKREKLIEDNENISILLYIDTHSGKIRKLEFWLYNKRNLITVNELSVFEKQLKANLDYTPIIPEEFKEGKGIVCVAPFRFRLLDNYLKIGKERDKEGVCK